jgi:hypothetical protein
MGVALVDASPFRLRTLQIQDPQLGPIRDFVNEKTNNTENVVVRFKSQNFLMTKDVLCVQRAGRQGVFEDAEKRIAVPNAMRSEIVQEAHNSKMAGHAGIFKTMERLRQAFWWPDMDKDVDAHIKACKPCQATTNKSTRPVPPLEQLPIPNGPNWRVHVDLFGPLQTSEQGNNYVLVMTDAFTKLVQLRAIKGKDAATVAEAIITAWVYTFGVPKHIMSDQGTEFCNELQRAIWTGLQIEHKVTTPYHPQTNSQAEVFNKTLAHYLRTVIVEADRSTLDWEMYLGPLTFSHNTAVHKATKMTPFYTTFGYDPRVPLWETGDLLSKDYFPTIEHDSMADAYVKIRTAQDAARKVVQNNSQHAKEQQAQQHDRANKTEIPSYKVGDLVWVKMVPEKLPNKMRGNVKLAPKWEEGVIIERMGFAIYRVRRDGRKRKKLATLNATKLKPRTLNLPAEPEEPQQPETPAEEEQQPPAQPELPLDDEESDEDPETEEEEEEYRPSAHHQRQQQQPQQAGPMTRARAKKTANINASEALDMNNIGLEELWVLLNNGYTLCRPGTGAPRAPAAAPTAPRPRAWTRRPAPPTDRVTRSRSRARRDNAPVASRTRTQSAGQVFEIDIDALTPETVLHLLHNGYTLMGSRDSAQALPHAAIARGRGRHDPYPGYIPPTTRSRSRSTATRRFFALPNFVTRKKKTRHASAPRSSGTTRPLPPLTTAGRMETLQANIQTAKKKSKGAKTLKSIKNFLSPGPSESFAGSSHPKGLRASTTGTAEGAMRGPAARQ